MGLCHNVKLDWSLCYGDIKRVGSINSGKVLLRPRFNESLLSRRIMQAR